MGRGVGERVVEGVKGLRLGHGLEAETDVGPVINHAQLDRIHSYMQVARDDGARILCGGEPAADGALANGSFFKPTLLGAVRPEMRVAQEEIFGPVLSLIEVETLDEAIAVNNGTNDGLSRSIFTRDINAAQIAMRDLASGIVYVNAGA